MKNFLAAYAKGWPVGVKRPNGDNVLVVGFCLFPNGVGYVDDSYTVPANPGNAVHQLVGP